MLKFALGFVIGSMVTFAVVFYKTIPVMRAESFKAGIAFTVEQAALMEQGKSGAYNLRDDELVNRLAVKYWPIWCESQGY